MFVVIAIVITLYQLYVGERKTKYFDETVEVGTKSYSTEGILNLLFVVAVIIFGVGGILITLGIFNI